MKGGQLEDRNLAFAGSPLVLMVVFDEPPWVFYQEYGFIILTTIKALSFIKAYYRSCF